MQKTVAAAIFKRSILQLKTQRSWQQPSRALSSFSKPVAAQVSLEPDTAARPPVCAYNEWDLLEVILLCYSLLYHFLK